MSGHVDLCLAAAARLQLAFEATSSDAARRTLLLCAADCLDKTRPDPRLACWQQQAQRGDPVALLVEHRDLLSALGPEAWPRRKIRPSQWPAAHADALRTLERHLKGEAPCPAASRAALLDWLAPVWTRYPVLRATVEQALA